MGTEFQVLLAGEDPEFLRDAAAQALDEVELLESRFSHYRPDSEISDLNLRAAYEPVRMEPGLFALIERAVRLSRETEGAFDIAVGPLIRLWGFYRGSGRPAGPEAVAEALERAGSRHLELDPEAQTIRFRREGVEVNLGAIGKGYAVDAAAAVLRELGIRSALVHGGTSTVYALGAPPGEEAWEVGLCHPEERDRRLGVIRLRDRALSTSGDYEQFFELEGRRYSHILDPRTGRPARGTRSATVLAGQATDSDALSTAAFVLGVERSKALLERYPGTAAVMVPETGDGRWGEVAVLGEVELSPEPGSPDD